MSPGVVEVVRGNGRVGKTTGGNLLDTPEPSVNVGIRTGETKLGGGVGRIVCSGRMGLGYGLLIGQVCVGDW